ncbi:MAG: hypothetical protein ACYDCP_11195 [Thermoplasmataceae archaeon]
MMRSMRPFLEIEWKNRNFLLHIVLSTSIFLALIGVIKLAKEPFVTEAISFSILSFVLLGLIWTITMIEDLKNDQESNLVKTFVSYPVTPVRYIASKQSLFLVSDLVSSSVGSLSAYAIIGNLKTASLELFILATFFAIFASRALFLVTSLISRLGFLAEIILVFYYFVILFLAFSITSQVNWLFTIFPYMHLFGSKLSLNTTTVPYTVLALFPMLYLGLILLTFLVLRIFKWSPLFDYD